MKSKTPPGLHGASLTESERSGDGRNDNGDDYGTDHRHRNALHGL
jgi:hypothetical protein